MTISDVVNNPVF